MPDVTAIIVTYFPEPSVLDNIIALRSQVECLVVIDNGSSEDKLKWLKSAAKDLNFLLVENRGNFGIAQALNQGIQVATSEWVVLFDQDSRVREGFVSHLLRSSLSFSATLHCGLVVPRYFDMRFEHLLPPILAEDGSIAVAMTSGSFLRRALFDEVGFFEDLFIYEVDYEFSLRIRKMGYTIQECSEAILDHNPGEPKPFCMFGHRLFYTTNYKPSSRYYMHRNAAWLRKKYGKDFPEYFRFSSRVLVKDYVKVLLGEDQKIKKLAYMLWGSWDAWRGNMMPLKSATETEAPRSTE